MMKSANDKAWEKLFEKYKILSYVDTNEIFNISASQIKEFREPRLMAKFDHTINLPQIFFDNGLSILPKTRGSYAISHFDAYHKFEDANLPITRLSLPTYLQSLNSNNIRSETVALNCAIAAGIINDFLQDEDLISTVSGRMSSGTFNFNIMNVKSSTLCNIKVDNSQIEIDAAYEGIKGLALFEAKRDLSEDFLIRQLYYPFRTWHNRVTKPVRSIFMIYSNGIYRLYEYGFEDMEKYNSIKLINQKNYSIEDTSIGIEDIEAVLYTVPILVEPNLPFPQADNFERIINLCELLNEQELSRDDVTQQYAFNSRQTNYYTDAARYLGLIDKQTENGKPYYTLNSISKSILNLNYKQRQLAYCRSILSHKPFNDTLQEYFKIGEMPEEKDIVIIMKSSNLYNVESDSTFTRRSSTIKGWLNWILGLINE